MSEKEELLTARIITAVVLGTCFLWPLVVTDAMFDAASPFGFVRTHLVLAATGTVICVLIAFQVHEWLLRAEWLGYPNDLLVSAAAVLADVATAIVLMAAKMSRA